VESKTNKGKKKKNDMRVKIGSKIGNEWRQEEERMMGEGD
jgi:hypothetical protein